MVTMEMRDEYRIYFQRINSNPQELLLSTLPAVHQIKLLMHIDDMSRVMSIDRGLCGPRTENCNAKSHNIKIEIIADLVHVGSHTQTVYQKKLSAPRDIPRGIPGFGSGQFEF